MTEAKRAAADFTYGTIILIGGMFVIGIGYYLFTELYSRETPSGIYNESSKLCLENYQVSMFIFLV
jgi:hypothetical protein